MSMNMNPNNLNSSEAEAAKQRADELVQQAKRSTWTSGILTTIVITVILIGLFYWIAYIRTS
ncbi:type VII secretion EssA family protein [Paenibacillus silvae]